MGAGDPEAGAAVEREDPESQDGGARRPIRTRAGNPDLPLQGPRGGADCEEHKEGGDPTEDEPRRVAQRLQQWQWNEH